MGQSLIVDGEQLSRLGKLCKVLCGRKGGRLDNLQKKLSISRRTIFRDLAVLGEMGIDIELTEKGYSVSQSLTESRERIAEYHQEALGKLLSKCLK